MPMLFEAGAMIEECFGSGPFIFRLNDSGCGPLLLTQVCLERGWKEFEPSGNVPWNLWWRTNSFPVGHHRTLYNWQFLNHVPKGASICRKDNLIRYLRCMRKIYGSIYDFIPNGFNLPLEYTKLVAECSRPKNSPSQTLDDKPIWICKPVAQSQGKGIFLFKKLSELNYDSNTVVQRYIEKPLLIGGYKFDLRLYVCIPSYQPLTIYMYREGLTRFGTDKFNLNDLRNPFRHLTNCSINKLGPGYSELKDRIGAGCKWTFRQLRRYFEQVKINDWLIWQKISCLVILTMISQASQIPQTVNCFEFFGFDVLIDSNLKPWLLEVNLSPALSGDCDADRLVKKPMLHDLFDLLGLPLYNTGLSFYSLSCSDFEDCNEKLSLTRTVVNAAGRWKKLKKPSSEHNVKKTYAKKMKSKTVFNVSGVKPEGRFSPKADNLRNKQSWGNGKDWKLAPPQEGGWVRIYPFHLDESNNIKTMVNEMISFYKTAKEVSKKLPDASDELLNGLLQQKLGITGEVWIPYL